MSYSFSIRGASIAALMAAAATQLDGVCSTQPAHARDRDLAEKNLKAHAELTGEPKEGQELVASVHGSISVTNPTAGEPEVTGAGSGCSVYRQQATAVS